MAVRAPMKLCIDYITIICIQYCVLKTIHHAAFNNTAEYTSLHAPKEALKTLLSTLLSTISPMLPIALNNTSRACLR